MALITTEQFAKHTSRPIVDPYEGRWPRIDGSVMLSPGSSVIGDVTLGADVSIWYQSVLRGDVCSIEIGPRTNIQDLTMVHTRYDSFRCIVGADVTVGHSVILHACTVKDRCLIGMGAIVLDGAEIGEDSVVGAHALVTQNKKFPPRSMILGSPAKAVRQLTDEEIQSIKESADHYVWLKNKYPLASTVFK